MMAFWKSIGLCGLFMFCLPGRALAQGRPPSDPAIADAISRGVDFLKGEQANRGEWNDPAQNQHPLGLTALAGLALLENSVARDSREISKAREIVTTLARESDQTYDLALAILFLARCQQARTGDADALIQTLGRRLAAGDHDGIWDYSVPRSDDEPTPSAARSRRGERRKTGRMNRVFSGGETTRTRSLVLLGSGRPGGMDSIPTRIWSRSTAIFGRPSSTMVVGDTNPIRTAPRPCRAPG